MAVASLESSNRSYQRHNEFSGETYMFKTKHLPLATRLSVFFLAMIGLVLAAFSSAIYWFASGFVYRQVEDQASATVNALTAAVEVFPDGIEWESNGRALSFGTSPLKQDIVWCVINENGETVDQSRDSDTNDFRTTLVKLPSTSGINHALHLREFDNWLIAERQITSSESSLQVDEFPAVAEDELHATLYLRAAVSLQPSQALRRTMALTLITLSVCVWLVTYTSARFVCSRALRPLGRMTTATRQLNVDRLAERLPILTTQDELAELTSAFNALLDRLQESLMRQQRFTGDASHQLRTPLTVLIGQIEVALRRERSADEYRRVLSLVHNRSTYMSNIVESLLFLTRADSEARLPDKQSIDLNSFLSDWIASFSEHDRYSDMQLESDDADKYSISSHPILLQELFTILLDNAFKFSSPGTPITIHCGLDSQSVIVTIRDAGAGIGANDIPHLGEPFFRTESARQRGIQGVGLGLSIASRLVATLGGTISFSSTYGKGTVATIRLRRAECVATLE